jgi:hypothetical protein
VSTLAQGFASNILGEHAGYFEVPGGHLYTVPHLVEKPVARLLLVGPFVLERHSSYIPWALWVLFDRLKELRLCLRRSELPGNANVPLPKHWGSLASAGLPTMVLKVPGPKACGAKPRLGEFDYLAHVVRLAGPRSRIDLQLVEGAGHSFADRVGWAAVRNSTGNWLGRYFPVAKAEASQSQDQELPSMEINPVTLGAPVPAYVSSGK